MIGIILAVGILVLILFIIITSFHNKFQLATIKINEADNNIDILLDKKRELLNRTRSIIKEELKLDEFLDDLDELQDKELSLFDMNNVLKDNYNELFKTLDDNEKLFKSEALISLIDDINYNEEEIVGTIKFYNDNVVVFNQWIGAFPSNLVAFFCRYRKKDFYNNEKREIYEILNNK